jgi:hypothetical protein
VPRPPLLARTAARWIATQEKLVSLYALTYLRIWMKIEWAYARHQREGLPLGVPDCTGSG